MGLIRVQGIPGGITFIGNLHGVCVDGEAAAAPMEIKWIRFSKPPTPTTTGEVSNSFH